MSRENGLMYHPKRSGSDLLYVDLLGDVQVEHDSDGTVYWHDRGVTRVLTKEERQRRCEIEEAERIAAAHRERKLYEKRRRAEEELRRDRTLEGLLKRVEVLERDNSALAWTVRLQAMLRKGSVFQQGAELLDIDLLRDMYADERYGVEWEIEERRNVANKKEGGQTFRMVAQALSEIRVSFFETKKRKVCLEFPKWHNPALDGQSYLSWWGFKTYPYLGELFQLEDEEECNLKLAFGCYMENDEGMTFRFSNPFVATHLLWLAKDDQKREWWLSILRDQKYWGERTRENQKRYGNYDFCEAYKKVDPIALSPKVDIVMPEQCAVWLSREYLMFALPIRESWGFGNHLGDDIGMTRYKHQLLRKIWYYYWCASFAPHLVDIFP